MTKDKLLPPLESDDNSNLESNRPKNENVGIKRSSELKKALCDNLAKSVGEMRVTPVEQMTVFIRQHIIGSVGLGAWSTKHQDRYAKEVSNIRERNYELSSTLEILIQKAHELVSNQASLSDEEFDKRYKEIDRMIDDFKQAERYFHKESFTLSFVDILAVENFEQYIKGRWPMQIIPHKEEVGRILTLAKEAHLARVGRDEAMREDPIRIVDIGGSNGALGKLVSDLARENGLKIEYIIVDPDKATVQAAREFYRDDHSLKFISQTSEEYVANLYPNDPWLKMMIDLRKNRIEDGERKVKELKVYLKKIESDWVNLESNELPEAMTKHCRILHEDFGIELDAASFSTYTDFLDTFEVEYIYEYDEVTERIYYEEKYRNQVLQPEINAITKQINAHLIQMPTTTDLTINSWMPPRVDLTNDIQFINSTAILYALEKRGATGCQSKAAFPEKPTRLGYGESYRQGDNYNSVFGWKSHSVPQIRQMVDYRDKDVPFTERLIDRTQNPRGVENVVPYSNTFVIQTRNNVSIGNIDPYRAGIKTGEAYPWEKELDERGGAIQPVLPVRDKDGMPDLSTM